MRNVVHKADNPGFTAQTSGADEYMCRTQREVGAVLEYGVEVRKMGDL